MLTVICHFTLRDGSSASASLAVPSPESRSEIQYAGHHDRLTEKPTRPDAVMLKLWAEDIAAHLGATLTVTESGHYDWYAE